MDYLILPTTSGSYNDATTSKLLQLTGQQLLLCVYRNKLASQCMAEL